MRRTTYHVVPRGDGWGCKVAGRWIVVSNIASLCDKNTYVYAVKALAKQNRPSEVVIHNRNGRIGTGRGSKSTYGADPRKSRG